jgi:hypothetical protein
MKLRDHPLMSFRGRRNWPPAWTPIRRKINNHLTGELGILLEASLSVIDDDRCYLLMEHEGDTYMGSLSFDDAEFCKRVCELLKSQRDRLIKEVGESDIDTNKTVQPIRDALKAGRG